ncbi:MAG: HesA/MoeB/ThiF family protein [Thermoprotei archaeon]
MLSDEEIDEYSRQIVLQDIGLIGQEKIKNGKIALIGVGGLGSPAAILLASMGLGYLKIVDRDVVSKTDLHRQPLYTRKDVDRPKVEVAEKRLKEMNPRMEIEAIAEPLTEENAENIIKDVDVVLDGLDNLRARYIINRTIVKLKKPYIFAAALEMYGNVTTIIPGETACLECFYGGIYDESTLPKCAIVGVHPSTTFIVASIAVSEALRIIMNQEPMLKNKLMYIDLRTMDFVTLNINRNEKCPVCGINPEKKPEPIKIEEIEASCARDGSGVYFVNKIIKNVDLSRIKERGIKEGWKPLLTSNLSITFNVEEGFDVTLLKSGTLIAKVRKVDQQTKEKILTTYKRLINV